ncbi:MAG: DUF1343 domain-containing protein [Myxococcales bacterium]|nr:DUF1343 domain-containing protein [Myxococcales bacterium]MCB9626533.1 DUF1343 domain-containing protein [Sandaracinaceae bacterium]
MTAVATGLDRVAAADPEVLVHVRGKRVGLLAHPASVTRTLLHAHAVLESAGAQVVTLFGPEHGYGGEAQDMAPVGSDESGTGGVPRERVRVFSLYGTTFDALRPTPDMLTGLDAVVVDLQDVGARYYTFVWSAALMLEAAAAVGIPTVVLDRPNPLGGVVLEGAPQRPGYRSFVGLYDVPVRHGLTIAEITRMVHAQLALDAAALVTVPMLGWQRPMYFDQTGLPWVYPSPNMPTLDTAVVYPGGCLIEGTLLSEGRGTTRPFEVFGGPWVDGQALASALDGKLPGAVLRPLHFQPTFQKHAKQPCGGVQLHVTDRAAFRSYEAYLRILNHLLTQYPDAPRYRTEEYEYVVDRPAIDLLTGGPEFRQATDAGASLEPWLAAEAAGAAAFEHTRAPFLLYP